MVFVVLCVMFLCVFVTFPCGVLCRLWYLIVLIPDFLILHELANKIDITFSFPHYILNTSAIPSEYFCCYMPCVSFYLSFYFFCLF